MGLFATSFQKNDRTIVNTKLKLPKKVASAHKPFPSAL